MIKNCKQCNKEYIVYGQRKKTGMFCSLICKGLVSRKSKVVRICKKCNKEFAVVSSRMKWGNGITFCSRQCSRKQTKPWLGKKRPEIKGWLKMYQKGHTPWNKGKKGEYSLIWSELTKQNWQKFWMNWREKTLKEKKMPYRMLHKYIEKILGKPDICEHCGKSGLNGRQIHWANKSREYKHNIGDWIRLCAKCHSKYDGNRGRKPKTLIETYSYA